MKPDVLIQEPMLVLAYLLFLLTGVFALSTIARFQKFFDFLPAVIWAYFLPMISTSLHIIPDSSPVYTWMTRYLLPFALFLLMLTMDMPSVLKLGKKGLLTMVGGSVTIVLSAVVSFALFGAFLPPEAWKEFGALTGSWIGGNANMAGIAGSFEPPIDQSRIIVMDTVVGYGWMGLLIWFSRFQDRFDAHVKADTSVIQELNEKLKSLDEDKAPITTQQLIYIVALGLAVAIVVVAIAQKMPKIGDPTLISAGTWAILMVTTLGIALSFTPARKLERYGASRIGYFALYIFLTTIGAQGDVTKIFATPLYFVAGIVWMVTHALLMYLMGRVLKAPLFMLATASMANVGGAASAPVVATAYQSAMAPVGVLMAMIGYAIGIHFGLVAAWFMSKISVWYGL